MSDAFPPDRPLRCDVFCRVVDNFGDAGVAWRLVNALHRQCGWRVRLIIDDLSTLARLAPGVDPSVPEQRAAEIDLVHWTDATAPTTPADIVIETFACEIPPAYVEAMAQRSPRPRWINLEYLSAEAWVDDCHGLASKHPRLPLTKHFFFPGFSARTGGVLIEPGLLAAQTQFRAAPESKRTFLTGLGADPDAGFTALVFCYPTPALEALSEAWRDDAMAIQCLLPRGMAGSALPAGGNLSVRHFDFVPQARFDALLWCCDFAVVRGEDSFVRAQLAGLVFVWHIYPQQDAAHLVKLRAFMERYVEGLAPAAAQAWMDLNLAWNEARHAELAAAWRAVRAHWAVLQQHALVWQARLVEHGDLTCHLQRMLADRLE